MDLPENHGQRKRLEIIRNSGLQAAEVVQDLLTLARRGIANQKVVNLNDVVENYILSPEYLALLEKNPEISVPVQVDAQQLNIVGSTIHLKTVIMNLVINSAEAQPSGGQIRISTRQAEVDEPLHLYETIPSGSYAVLTVEDQGSGISDEHIGRIFEPFYSHKPMTQSGSGLGMTVVWGVVHDHMGFINIESHLHQGCCIECYFPTTEQSIETVEPSEEITKGEGQQILVIDDLLEQREVAREMLRYLGYSATLCDSGESAISLLKDRNFDLIMLDMVMEPGIDGLDTYVEIRKIRPGTPTIIVSGYAETERVKQALQLGVKLHFKKPYSIRDLGSVINSLIN